MIKSAVAKLVATGTFHRVARRSSALTSGSCGCGSSGSQKKMTMSMSPSAPATWSACKPRHRHQEFLAFLKQVSRAYPVGVLHLVMDNYATHKKVEIRDWLMANPRIHMHFTPTSGSWLNLVEIWPGISDPPRQFRGLLMATDIGSVRDLTPRSAPSSTAGTTAATRSSGPRPPSRSSRRPRWWLPTDG